MKLNDVFGQNQYDEAYNYIESCGLLYTIKEIEPAQGGERQFQIVEIPQPTQEEIDAREIAELKTYLVNTDYVVIKIAEGVATQEEYSDIIAARARARTRINELGE